MMNIKSWWNKDKEEIARLQASNEALLRTVENNEEEICALKIDVIAGETAANELATELSELTDELTVAKEELAKADHSKSIVPWFEITTDGMDPVKGLQVKLDWNEALVQHLKDNGHTGRDDEILIQKWLAMLYEDIINQLEAKIVNLNTQHNTSEFE
jgi:hypothetical protein